MAYGNELNGRAVVSSRPYLPAAGLILRSTGTGGHNRNQSRCDMSQQGSDGDLAQEYVLPLMQFLTEVHFYRPFDLGCT